MGKRAKHVSQKTKTRPKKKSQKLNKTWPNSASYRRFQTPEIESFQTVVDVVGVDS